MEAIIYIAHGSKRESANQKFIDFIKKVIAHSDASIQTYAFLEHADPSIGMAIEFCIEKGAREITVVPILLLPGIHANEDIPAECKAFPGVVFRFARPLGFDEIMLEINHERLNCKGYSSETVLLVGHGSRESDASVEFEKLAKGLRQKLRAKVETAYLTTADFFHEKVESLQGQTVYILPYLLFSGAYTVKMEKIIKKFNSQFILCEPVGFDEKLIPLIQKRVDEVFL